MTAARWNDETQSWETPADGPPGAKPVPAPDPGAGPGAVGAPGPGPVAGPVVPPTPPPLGPPPPPPPAYAPEYAPGHGPVYHPETGQWEHPGAAPAPAVAGRLRGAVVAGVAAAVVVAGSVGGWLLWRGGEDEGVDPVAGGPATSVSSTRETEPPSGSPSEPPPSTSASPTAPTDDLPPPGYRAVEDLKGFTIAVPEDWDRTESDQGVFYNAPDGRSLLQVFVVQEAGLTPYEALRGVSEDGRTNKRGYEEISLERITDEPGAPSDTVELVYAYDRDGGRRKVVDRAFTAPDGTHYAVLVAGPETAWPKQRDHLRVALEFFRPAAS